MAPNALAMMTDAVPLPGVIVATASGTARLTLRADRIGPDQVACGPRRPCGVSVVTDDGFVVAGSVPVSFSLGPGAAYERVGFLSAYWWLPR